MKDLHELFNRDDFKAVWRRIATDIKIRTYENLKDLPEVYNLPSSVQQQMYSASNGTGFNYETIRDEGYIYNTAYIVLLDQRRKTKWLGIFQYNYATTAAKIVGLFLVGGVCVGGIYYYSAAAAKYVSSVVGYISKNYQGIQDGLIKCAGILLTGGAFYAFKCWLMNEHSEWNLLIAACILKKIESIRDT